MILYCMRDDATQQINTCSRFLSLHSPPQANASGLLQFVGEALQFVSVEKVLDAGGGSAVLTSAIGRS